MSSRNIANLRAQLTVKMLDILLIIFCLSFSSTLLAANVKYRKTQDVSFDGSDVDGKTHNPDGSYVSQKRGVDFMPLYQVRRNFDDSIRESVHYLK